jgi:hypothetical protein
MKNKILGFFVSLILFICIVLFLKQCGKSDEKKNDYRGILINIFKDHTNRDENTYKIQTLEGYTNLTVRSYPESVDYIEIGDSIIKKKGKLSIIIKKKKYEYNRMAIFYYK